MTEGQKLKFNTRAFLGLIGYVQGDFIRVYAQDNYQKGNYVDGSVLISNAFNIHTI